MIEQIKEMAKGQKPVAWLHLDSGMVYSKRQMRDYGFLETGRGFTPLYTHTAVAAPAGVPDGWKLVPVEPTSEMRIAAHSCFEKAGMQSYQDASVFYEAMLSAAPAAPADAERCDLCDCSGDIHRADGEWLGECPHCKPSAPADVAKDGDGRTVQKVQEEAAAAERKACLLAANKAYATDAVLASIRVRGKQH